MKEKIWYFCDPEKNTACPKTACAYNPQAKHRRCYTTSKKEFARLDFNGDPCEDRERNMSLALLREALAATNRKPCL